SKSHKLKWTFDQQKIAAEERLDGCYVIRTDTPQDQLTCKNVVHAYKSLGNVERAFRNLKTIQLEMRPVYHKTDDRIRAHVFLCMLAYYVQWHMQQRLKPLFDSDGSGSERRWTFAGIIECMRQRCRHTVSAQNVQFQQDGALTEEQQKITDLLNIT
ncbi:MAG: transposase, partial [Thermodesulfobacteriota bacterium]|nr:transposase [Thermodesulfobacteriota bacterium]